MPTWSEQQQDIFAWFANPRRNLVVRARAGTGKTTTIVEAVKHIHDDVDFSPKRILVAAFNKRIAVELQTKLEGTGADALTLHALGYKFVRGAWGDVNVSNDVEDDRIAAAAGGGKVQWEAKIGLKKLIGIAKGAAPFAGPDTLTDLCVAYGCDGDYADAGWMGRVAHKAMQLSLIPDLQSRISFDDMLYLPVALHLTMPLYDWVIVDEAQDMNLSQLLLAQKACVPGGHIVVVGDDRQAIYGFRGADSDALDRLKVDLQAEEMGLNTTYRCPQGVVALANTLVPDYTAAPWAPEGGVERCAVNELVEKVQPGDVILSRANAPLVALCLMFIRNKRGARIEGRDIGKLLSARAKKLKASTVEQFLTNLAMWSQRSRRRAAAKGLTAAAETRIEQIGDIESTLTALAEDAENIDEVYQRCERLFDDVGAADNMVVLSTVHKAKGLEWNRVFLLTQTLYCNGRRAGDLEEANIHYVAMTRAKQQLFLVGGK
jgi:superfamily I DNA/RNA helicase